MMERRENTKLVEVELVEVAWLEGLAAQHSVIKGIVGGLDLTQARPDYLSII